MRLSILLTLSANFIVIVGIVALALVVFIKLVLPLQSVLLGIGFKRSTYRSTFASL